MAKPIADYECTGCMEAQGLDKPVLHTDLPVDAKFCPACGSNKGFEKIWTANFMSGVTRKVGKVLDEQLRPMYDKDSKQKQGASDFARAGQEALEKHYEKAPAVVRAQLPTTFRPHVGPADQVFGGMDRGAKQDSREYGAPMLKRQVRPRYER